MFVKQFVGACGGASLLQGISKHPRRQACRLELLINLAPPQAISHYTLTGRGARARDCDWPRSAPPPAGGKCPKVHALFACVPGAFVL